MFVCVGVGRMCVFLSTFISGKQWHYAIVLEFSFPCSYVSVQEGFAVVETVRYVIFVPSVHE